MQIDMEIIKWKLQPWLRKKHSTSVPSLLLNVPLRRVRLLRPESSSTGAGCALRYRRQAESRETETRSCSYRNRAGDLPGGRPSGYPPRLPILPILRPSCGCCQRKYRGRLAMTHVNENSHPLRSCLFVEQEARLHWGNWVFGSLSVIMFPTS